MPKNLNIDPYYDDYDHKKGFHKILFKPGVAVQARELTQIQSILQNQVTKFADHIFEDGSVVSGANHTIDYVSYFKIADSFNGGAIVFDADIIGKYIVVNSGDLANPDNRKFLVKTITQKTATDPKTIYASLISGGPTGSSSAYVDNNARLDVYSVPNPVIGTTTVFRSFSTETTGDKVSGNSVLFSIDEGVFYTKNSFVYCPTQTAVVSKYTTSAFTGTITASTSSASITGVGTLFTTELKVGDEIFTYDNKLIGTVLSIASNTQLTLKNNSNTLVTENALFNVPLSKVIGLKVVDDLIVTSDEDATLLDPSFGSYNYAAPGADRYVISLEISVVTYQEQSLSSEDFIDICHIKNGVVESDQRLPIYSNIENLLARRTYDESGNYIVTGLLPTVKANPDDTLLTLSIASGKAYVKGFEIEKNGVSSIELTKPRTYTTTADYTISTQYGNYITVNSISGRLPDISKSSTINFYSDTLNSNIGTGRVINLIPVSYDEYQLYLDDVQFTKGSIVDVSSITEIAKLFTAKLIEGKISDTANRLLVFPIQLGNIKTVTGASYATKKLYKSIPIYGGVCSLTSDILTKDFVPSSGTQNNINYVVSLTTLTSGTGYVVGSVLNLSSATITVNANPDTNSSVTINFHDSSFNAIIDIIATINVSGQPVRTKTLVSNYGVKVAFDDTSIIPKSLGVSDVHKFIGAYNVGNRTYSGVYDPLVTYPSNAVVMKDGKLYDIDVNVLGTTAKTNIGDKFQIDSGQTDSFYGNGTINRKSSFTSPITVLAIFHYYNHSGEGPLVVNNTIGASYSDIGEFSDSVGFTTYKLRNCLDFRPIQKINAGEFNSFILPYSNAVLDVEYYLGRIDKLCLDSTGKYQLIQGIPARKPVTPASILDAMDICTVTYEPYTDNEASTKISLVKNKRYTMKDIGALEGRIENVEYYTSLSMLEKETSSKTFTDDNGTPLFNNGFLVDAFQGKNVSDVTNPDMKAEIDFDKNELRPNFYVKTARANLATTGTGINSNTISLPYTTTKLTGVNTYSSTVSVNPYNVVTASGSAKLTPDTDHWVKTLSAVNDAETISKLSGSSDITQVTVWNAWKPTDTLSTSAITGADSDFIDISTSKNKIVNGTVFNFSKNIIPVTRENIVQYKVSNMLPNTSLYYFFGDELQEDKFVTNATGSTFLSTPPVTDSTGSATGYIVIPSNRQGSTFVITFCNTPAGKAYSSSYVSVNYYVDMSAKYAESKPISVVTGDQVGESTVTELKIPKPTATYSIEPTSYAVNEGDILTFKFKAINYDLKGNFIGNIIVSDGTATFTSKTVNGVAFTSLTNFTFDVDAEGVAAISLAIADDGVSQAARKITLNVTINNKSNRTANKYPEFLFDSVFSNSVKLLNPVKTEYSVVAPVSVGVDDMLNVTFQSNNAEADIPISYKVYRKVGTESEVNVTSSFTSPSNPFNTSNTNPTHTLVRNINQDSASGETLYKDKNGNYRFVFTDAKGNSKESNVKIRGFFETKYYNVSNNSLASNAKQGSTVTFTIDTNHYNTNLDTDTIPFLITVDGVDISTLSSQFTVTSGTTAFTGTVKTVSVVISNSAALTKTKLLKLELSGTGKGKGTSSVCYLQSNVDNVAITANKTAYSNISDNESINFTVTSSYGTAASGFPISEIAVSNLNSDEYTLSATSGVLNSSGVFTFTLTGAALRTARVDKTFVVSLKYNNATTLTSTPFNMAASSSGGSGNGGVPGSSGATAAVVFRNDANTADVTTLNKDVGSGLYPPVKLKITLTGVKLTEKFTIQIAAPLQPGTVRQMSNTTVFDGTGLLWFGARGISLYDVYSLTLTGQELLDLNYILPVKFAQYCPENYELRAEVKAVTRDELVGTAHLLLQKPSKIFTIASDKSVLDAWSSANLTIKTPNEKIAKTVNWTLFGTISTPASKYFDTVSGTGTIAASSVDGGASLVIPVSRNGTVYTVGNQQTIGFSVTDVSGVTLTAYNYQLRLGSGYSPLTSITFFDENGVSGKDFVLGDKIYPCKVEIFSANFKQGDKLSYSISPEQVYDWDTKSWKVMLDLFTSSAGVSPVTSIDIKDAVVDSNKKVSTNFWIKKNGRSKQTQLLDASVSTFTSGKTMLSFGIGAEKGEVQVRADVQSVTSPVPDSLAMYRSGFKGETAFSITTGTDYNLFVDTTLNITASDKAYLAVLPYVANVTTLSTSNFTIKVNGSTITGNNNTKPFTAYTKLNDILNSNITLLYDVSTMQTASGLINFKLNAGTINANDKVILSLYVIKNAATTPLISQSAPVHATLSPAAVKSYTASMPVTIFNGKSTTIAFTPINFASGDTHTLRLPLSNLTLANDVIVTVNDTTITTISSTGVLTPSITLTGNNTVTIKVTSKSDASGTIDAVINNVADTAIKSDTHIDTNKGITIAADKTVNQTIPYQVQITPRATDTSYQVGVFDYSTGSYVEIAGTGGTHIVYTDMDGKVLTSDPTTHLITLFGSSLGAGNVGKFKYTIPNGFNPSTTNSKLCRIRFVGSDGAEVFSTVNVNQTAAKPKSFIITNDASSETAAKQEGGIVTFTVTPTNSAVTDTYNYTIETTNERTLNLVGSNSAYATKKGYVKSFSDTENTIKVQLDKNAVINQTTDIILTLYPTDVSYTGEKVSKGYVNNPFTPHQEINIKSVSDVEETITEVFEGSPIFIEGVNNVPINSAGHKSIKFDPTLVRYVPYVGPLPVATSTTVVDYTTTPGTLVYTNIDSTNSFNFTFVATGNGALYEASNKTVEFVLNGDLVKKKLIIKETTVPATISITQKNGEIYENSGSIVFEIDTSLINSDTEIPFTLTCPDSGVTITSIEFRDGNNLNKVIRTVPGAAV